MTAFEPRRLTLARRRNGWTKKRLAEIIGVTPAAITQYELGQARPSAASLSRLATQLGVSVSYFAAGRPLFPIGTADAHFRSLRSTRMFEREQALATVAHLAELVLVLSRVVRLPPLDLPDVEATARTAVGRQPDSASAEAVHVAASGADLHTQTEFAIEVARDETPERAAQSVRRAWRLSPGPLPHLLRQLEMHGIVVAVARFSSSERIDAFSCWPARLDRPVMCLTRDRGNVLRRRFSAAHELGHLILHRQPAPGSALHEREADRFAAEFLMPAADIRPILPHRLDLAQLVELQQQWGVSVQALLHRCNDLNTISQTIYKRGMAAITQIGWRRNEPTLEYGGEWPAMLAEALKLAESRGLTERILADGLCLPPTEMRELLGFTNEDRPRLHLVSSEPSVPMF